jgi:hypothetical protein
MYFIYLHLMVLEMKPRGSHVLGKYSVPLNHTLRSREVCIHGSNSR